MCNRRRLWLNLVTAICQRDFAQLSLGRTEAEEQGETSAGEQSPPDTIANPLVLDEGDASVSADVDDDPVTSAQSSPYSHPIGAS